MAKLNEQDKAEILKQYACGYSASEIAKKFQVSHTAISKILKNAKSFDIDEKVSKSSKELRKSCISKAENALYGLDYSKLHAETLLKIIERLSILEPKGEEESEQSKVTLTFEFKDTAIKGVEDERNNPTEV